MISSAITALGGYFYPSIGRLEKDPGLTRDIEVSGVFRSQDLPLLPHLRAGQKMSTAAKLTLAGTSAAAVGIVFFVHYAQKNEKAVSIPKSSPYALLSFVSVSSF